MSLFVTESTMIDHDGDEDDGHENVGEQEVANMVGSKVLLDAVLRLPVGHAPDAGVVDEDVDVIDVGRDLLSTLAR